MHPTSFIPTSRGITFLISDHDDCEDLMRETFDMHGEGIEAIREWLRIVKMSYPGQELIIHTATQSYATFTLAMVYIAETFGTAQRHGNDSFTVKC